MTNKNKETRPKFFNTPEEEKEFFKSYQVHLNKALQTAYEENIDRFFVQKKLLQFLAATGALYTFVTQQERLPATNTLLLGACAGALAIASIREKNQIKEMNLSAFKEAHFSFCSNKSLETKDVSKKIKLLKFSDAILPIENLDHKKQVATCYWLSTLALIGGNLTNKIAFEPAVFAETLIWGSCTLANYINNKAQIKLIQNNLPKEIKFTEQKSYER